MYTHSFCFLSSIHKEQTSGGCVNLSITIHGTFAFEVVTCQLVKKKKN